MQNSNNIKVIRSSPVIHSNVINSESISPQLSFKRASTASYMGIDGFLKWVGVDIPRIEYNPITKECLGIKIEPTATNHLLNSRGDTIGNAVVSNAWYQSGGGSFSMVDQDTLWIDEQKSKLMSLSHTSAQELIYSHPTRAANDVFLSFSFFILPINLQPITVELYSGTTRIAQGIISFAADKNGSVVSKEFEGASLWNNCSVERITNNGWSRIHLMTCNTTVSTEKVVMKVRFTPGINSCSIHGWQLEDTPYLTSYISTADAAAIRLVDNLHIPASQVISQELMRDNQITIITESRSRAISTINHITAGFSLRHSSNWRCRTLVHESDIGDLRVMMSGRLLGVSSTVNAFLTHDVDKERWKDNGLLRIGITLGGGTPAVVAAMGTSSIKYVNAGDFTNNIPSIFFGTYEGTSSVSNKTTAELGFNGYLRDIIIINKRVSARELRALTDPNNGQLEFEYLGLLGPTAE